MERLFLAGGGQQPLLALEPDLCAPSDSQRTMTPHLGNKITATSAACAIAACVVAACAVKWCAGRRSRPICAPLLDVTAQKTKDPQGNNRLGSAISRTPRQRRGGGDAATVLAD